MGKTLEAGNARQENLLEPPEHSSAETLDFRPGRLYQTSDLINLTYYICVLSHKMYYNSNRKLTWPPKTAEH